MDKTDRKTETIVQVTNKKYAKERLKEFLTGKGFKPGESLEFLNTPLDLKDIDEIFDYIMKKK